MKILVMGGTRFVGKSLVEKFLSKDLKVDIFTRGNNPIPAGANFIKGDRNKIKDIEQICKNNYDYIFDISGRELNQTQLLIDNLNNSFKRYLYVSSAGVYKTNTEIPILETDSIDSESRHKGKFETEDWLIKEGIPFTSFRPTYIYGPNNYNKIENWFFERIINNKQIPIPGDGLLLTQLGHVSDLTDAMIKSIETEKTKNQIYNCSGEKGVTIKGLIYKCAEVCNIEINKTNLFPFDYRKLDPKARKLFPIRLTHYLTSINKLKNDLNWQPKFDLFRGLKNSFNNDFIYKKDEHFDPNSDKLLFNS
tara:strand:+ start:2178 stop:3098 length:921 start_codon:yes stop_codon:yes gene_type:complete